MVLRQIPNKLLSFDDLGTPPVLKDLIMRPRGLVLVTGPTGSGKTTTLAAAIDYLNETVDAPHHYDRRPDRVLSPAQEMHGQPA